MFFIFLISIFCFVVNVVFFHEGETECSKTWAHKIQMQGNHTKERIQHSEHRESLKSTVDLFIVINADKNKYMVMSQDQNAGRKHSIENDDSSFERLEEFKSKFYSRRN